MDISYLRNRDPLRRFLGRFGVYERVKVSCIYDFYWALADKRIINDRQKQIDFYHSVLSGFGEGDLIFDIGANLGYKADIFLKMGAVVVAVEPDELNQEILRQKFLKYRLKKKPLVIVGKAASEKNSIEKMWIDKPGSALNTLSNKWAEALRDDHNRFGQSLTFGQSKEIETVSINDLIAKYGEPFFVKIDVEGHELSVLRGMRRPVPYLSFEVNLPEFRREGLECLDVLASLAVNGQFNYTSDCRQGLTLCQWIPKGDMAAILDSCSEESIEIFWRTETRGSR